MAATRAVFIGIRGRVLALDPATGDERWRTDLKGADMVNVAWTDSGLYASTRGQIYALNPTTGKILWRNKLKGLGLGFVSIAGSQQAPAMARQRQKQQAAVAGATSAVVASS